MADFETECVVIGAGVVGLAVARALALAGHETMLLEAASGIGTGTSSRNSEVIHAGIYYAPGSLKAKLCVEGRGLLYEYARTHGVPHKQIGKLIVAMNEAQSSKLDEIMARAKACGVNDLEYLSADDAHKMEPHVVAAKALFSPSTGIIDSHSFMESLLGDFENAGGAAAFLAPVESGEIVTGGVHLNVGGAEPCRITAKYMVNSAGLDAPLLLKRLKHFPTAHIPPTFYAKGNYFILNGRSPFTHLVYPIPEAAGLGIHATLDMGGQCRFGPDVEWVEKPDDLVVNPARAESFYKAIRTYWPALPDDALAPGYAGMRPKLSASGAVANDFVIQDEKAHGVPGLINLMGIESPGLTSSLAIANVTKNLLFS